MSFERNKAVEEHRNKFMKFSNEIFIEIIKNIYKSKFAKRNQILK